MSSENSSNPQNERNKKNPRQKLLAIALRQNLKRRKAQAKNRSGLSKPGK